MKRIYLSGPMTGLSGSCFRAFAAAAAEVAFNFPWTAYGLQPYYLACVLRQAANLAHSA
ncbi:hypothetical protein PS684_00164 [Pseudomonas fluorescens]|nr:hypothetical protein PS681_01006 [Pseudomonas fluorescens]VVN50046.1 hypothetical protein PS684_00164 [Pseudomonas fluorescens]